MGQFVDIRSSVSEIIGIAGGLRDRGQQLHDAAERAEGRIRGLEARGETFPSDDFTDSFLRTYHAPTENGPTVHLAATASARDAGTRLAEIGEYVANAMWTYSAADDEGGTDIAGTPRP